MNQDKSKFNKEVWVAVLHYQGAENTRACLESIKRLNLESFQILITDNDSPDKSGKELAKDFPDCHFLELSENLGFSGGANASVNYCIENGASFVWLLNNDTRVEENSLAILIEEAEKHPQAGILSAAVYMQGKSGLERSGTGEIDFWQAKTFERGKIDCSLSSQQCQWLSGCNMLFNAAAFRELRGFDESYFLYFEDTDLCWRMRQSGWHCLIVPAAGITHIGGASTEGRLSIWRSYYYTRNRLLFFLKARQGLSALPIIFSVTTHLIRHLLVLPFRGRDGKRQLKAEILGFFDYWKGKLGKANCLDF